MEKFSEIKDSNGTALQSYAELLQEKAKEAGFVTIMVFGSQGRDMVHTISNLAGSVPDALISIGSQLKSQIEAAKAN